MALAYAEKQTVAGEVVELLLAGDWERLSARSTPEMRQVLEGRPGARRVWRRATRGKGSYTGIDAQLFTQEHAEPFQADITVGFERGSTRVRVAINGAGLINGLVLQRGDWR